jgi:hypothetical protein
VVLGGDRGADPGLHRRVSVLTVDAEDLRALGPWWSLALVLIIVMVIWARAHRHYHVSIDITVTSRRSGGRAMAPVPVPGNVIVFENYVASIEQANGNVIFAGLTKNANGCVVFDSTRILWEATGDDFGAPSLLWRGSDGQLLLTSCFDGGKTIYFEKVPGVFKDGRLP